MSLYYKLRRIIKYRHLRKRCIFISNGAIVDNTDFEKIGYNQIDDAVFLLECYVGRGTYIRNGCLFKKTKIGRYCSIAPNVKIIYGKHPTSTKVAMHPSFYKNKKIANLSFNHETGFEEYEYTSNGFYCEIGNDVWIGTDAKIMGGVTIGDGCIVAAGTIVTKNIPPYSIVAGIPGKIVKYRFSDDQITFLEKFQWWSRDLDWIHDNIGIFDSIDEFCKLADKEADNK